MNNSVTTMFKQTDPFTDLAKDVKAGDTGPAQPRGTPPSAETVAMMEKQGFTFTGNGFVKTTKGGAA